jgi:hypothetical protein
LLSPHRCRPSPPIPRQPQIHIHRPSFYFQRRQQSPEQELGSPTARVPPDPSKPGLDLA